MSDEVVTPPKVLVELKAFEKSNDWKKAESLLTQHKKEFDAGVYYYNLGIIKLRQENYVEARVALEKASLNAYDSLILNKALSEVKSNLSAEAIETITPWGEIELTLIRLPVQFYLSTTLVILIIFLLIKKYFTSIITKVFWILFAILPLIFKLFLFPEISVIVTKTDVPIFFGPSKVFEKVSELPPGIKVFITKEKTEDKKWFYVSFPKDLQGWIESDETSYEIIREEI